MTFNLTIRVIEQTQGFRLTDKPSHSNIGSPSIGDSRLGVSTMPVIAITLALNTGALAAMKLATVLAF